MISVIGETSNLAATLGKTAFPKAVAGAKICVKLNCFWVANIRGVNVSAVKPLNTSLSATSTLDMPDAFAIASAAFNNKHMYKELNIQNWWSKFFSKDLGRLTGLHLVPATRTEMSPPIFFAAPNALRVAGNKVSLLCSATTRVL